VQRSTMIVRRKPIFGRTTPESLIALNLWLTLNQRVPGSSPGAPTIAKAFFFNRLREELPRTNWVSCDVFSIQGLAARLLCDISFVSVPSPIRYSA
jgi:hypothetical protein